jgi:hypothetical protein
MIKCIIDKEIDGIYFKIVYISQKHNVNSFFTNVKKDYYYVIVDLDNFSILKENRDYALLPEFKMDKLIAEYYDKHKQQHIHKSAKYLQEV